ALEERPDLILLDVMMPDMDGYEVARRLRKNPATESIPILMFTAKTQLDDKVTGFEVGADDYLTKPTHPTELQAHVKALLARAPQKSKETPPAAAPQEKQGYIVGVISARGGLGVTSVSMNLAAAIYSRIQDDVVFAELLLGQGTVGLDFGYHNPKGLTELLQGTPVEITREKLEASLSPHSSGVKLLLASSTPRDMTLISQDKNYETLIRRLAGIARFVVLDMGSGLPAFAQKILPMCNECLVVMEGVSSAIQHTRYLIEDIVALKVDPRNIRVVLNNRVRSESQMPMSQAQEKLGHSIAATLTPAPEAFLQAARLQTPAVISQPTNITSQQFFKLADSIIEREKSQ
ncbi:MAG: response regulator, partial [Chloroflexi bacterium]|nr:response regulator [Chloroflexota bacterium]